MAVIILRCSALRRDAHQPMSDVPLKTDELPFISFDDRSSKGKGLQTAALTRSHRHSGELKHMSTECVRVQPRKAGGRTNKWAQYSTAVLHLTSLGLAGQQTRTVEKRRLILRFTRLQFCIVNRATGGEGAIGRAVHKERLQ